MWIRSCSRAATRPSPQKRPGRWVSPSTKREAGLLIKLYSPAGEVYYALKPYRPRTEAKENDKRKFHTYEQQGNFPSVVDIHPSMRWRLLFSEEPLYVTEGAKKGDCLASRDRLAVDLAGVGRGECDRPELLSG